MQASPIGLEGRRGHKRRIEAEAGKRNGNVGFATTEGSFEARRLKQTLISGRLQPEHHLAERDDASIHFRTP